MKKIVKFLFYPLLILIGLLFFADKTGASIFLSALVFAFYTSKYSLKYTVLGILLLFVFVAYLKGTEGATFSVLFVLPGIIMGICIYLKSTFSVLMISTSASELLALTVYTRFISDKFAVKPVDLVFGGMIEGVKQTFSSQEFIPAEAGLDALSIISGISDLLQTMLPAFYILFSVFSVYVLFAIVRFLSEKGGEHLEYPHFYELGFPKSVSMIFLLIFLISMFTASPILTNVVSVMFTLHVICGLSLVDYILVQRKMPKVLRVLILGIILTISGLLGGLTTTILCCFGMNDSVRFSRK